ncbi:hypothetical protein Dimus_008660 [Dionaea muscipula]
MVSYWDHSSSAGGGACNALIIPLCVSAACIEALFFPLIIAAELGNQLLFCLVWKGVRCVDPFMVSLSIVGVKSGKGEVGGGMAKLLCIPSLNPHASTTTHSLTPSSPTSSPPTYPCMAHCNL